MRKSLSQPQPFQDLQQLVFQIEAGKMMSNLVAALLLVLYTIRGCEGSNCYLTACADGNTYANSSCPQREAKATCTGNSGYCVFYATYSQNGDVRTWGKSCYQSVFQKQFIDCEKTTSAVCQTGAPLTKSYSCWQCCKGDLCNTGAPPQPVPTATATTGAPQETGSHSAASWLHVTRLLHVTISPLFAFWIVVQGL